jgi:non-ribosomal peptide synthetase component F/thioesterase domain-containing protein
VNILEDTKPVSPELNSNSQTSNPDAATSGTEEVFVLPASLGQERFGALDRMNPGNPTWSVPVRFRLQGPLDTALLERAFNDIIQRHEVLRTTFTVVDERPAQVVKSTLEIKVPVVDLRQFPKPERDAEVDRLSFNEARWRFDLAVGPLFRVTLLRVEDNEYVMLVTPHHSVIDYLSIGLISNELGVLYEAYTRNLDPVLPELSIQYGDYAVWQREQSESLAVQKELEYWKEQLKDLPLLDVPTDKPRQASPTFEATITSLLLPVTLTDAVRQIGNSESATFFNTVLSALGVLMYQYTGQTDFGAATQVAGRTSVELESVIGPFINTVVLRLDLSGNPTFPQLLQRVQEVGLQSIANQNVRYEQVLKELRPNDYPSHHTLFRLNFICQRDPVRAQEFAGIKLTVIPSKSQGALYDLHVFLVHRNEGWRLACEYNTDLYEAATITRLLTDFKALLENIVDNPNRPLSAFPVSEGAMRARQKRAAGSSPSSSNSRGASASSAPRSRGAAAAAVAPAVSKYQSDSSAECDSEEKRISVSVDAALSESFGLPASVAQRRFFSLEEIVPGNPALHMRACVRLTGKVSLDHLKDSFRLLVERHESLRTTFQKDGEQLIQIIHPSQTIDLPVTSIEKIAATNGQSNALTDNATTNSASTNTNNGQDHKLWESIRAEASSPFDLAHGPLLRVRLFRLSSEEHVLIVTTHHIIVDGFSQNVIQRDLWAIYEAASRGETPNLPPLSIQYGDFAHWQEEWLESEGAAEELEFWKTQLQPPLPALNFPTDRPSTNRPASRGAMETLLLSADLTAALKALAHAEGATAFTVFLAGYAALLCRYAGQEEVVVGSPVANRKPETEGLIGPFASPITLRLNLSGDPTLKELLARVRDITFDALNHAELPFEVLMDHLDVRSVNGRNPLSQCYFFYQQAFLRPRELDGLTVTPLPDFGLGTHFELQMGLLDRREGLRAQLEYNPDLFDAFTIRQLLDDYKKVLELMRDVPEARLHELEVSRRSVPLHPSEPTRKEDRESEPRRVANPTERKLQRIWESLLGVSPIGLNQNYFDLGGTSILAVRLFAQISKEFQRKLPLSVLFEAQTIAQLAKVLETDTDSSGWSPLVAIQPQGSKPPFFCIHGGGGNVLIYRDLSRHLGDDQPFYGLQAIGMDGEKPPLTTIEAMASLYVKEIRRFQPYGPYHLGGYCMGGTVAYEAAQQLYAQGQEVALLALFDTMNWCNIPPDNAFRKVRQALQRIKFHTWNFLLLNTGEKKKFFNEKVKVLRSRSTIWKGMLMGKLRAKQSGDKSESVVLAEMWRINDTACVVYQAEPYDGIITDFRPMRQYAKYSPAEDDWSRLARGGHEILTLPVYPAGMLLEPFVKHLADALKVTISRTISGSSSRTTR